MRECLSLSLHNRERGTGGSMPVCPKPSGSVVPMVDNRSKAEWLMNWWFVICGDYSMYNDHSTMGKSGEFYEQLLDHYKVNAGRGEKK